MNLLIVKLSSLGDVVHAMPAVQDIRRALPQARIDWVVERAFAPLAQRCDGVSRVIACELRQWAKAPLSAATRKGWRAFREELRAQPYDAVLDLQGLTKSALISRTARTSAQGKRYALGNRTEGSSYEAPTRWVADEAIRIEPRVSAVERSRMMCAHALGYGVPGELRFGLQAQRQAAGARIVAFVHGSSRDDKCWPAEHWIGLGQRLVDEGFSIALPQGSAAEHERALRIAAALGDRATVWPAMDVGAVTDRLAACEGVIGVDSGLSHIAVALDLPHVQIYNFDTAWRTGPRGARQRSVFAQPAPGVAEVLDAWHRVMEAA